MAGLRRRYSAECNAGVLLETIRGELTVSLLAVKHDIHQTMTNAWKKEAVEGMAGVLSGKAEVVEAARTAEIDRLPGKVGRLVVERGSQRQATGRSASGGAGR